MRKVLSSLALAAALFGAASHYSPETLQAKEDRHEVKYSFPSPIAGVDFGQQALVDAIAKQMLSAERVVELAFDGMPYIFLVDMLGRLPSTELQALDKEIEDANLTTTIGGAGSNYEKGQRLDEARVSERDLVRGLGKVVKDFEAEEAAAMIVQMRYGEQWLLNRLNLKDTSAKAFKDVEDAMRKDADRPSRLWSDAVGRESFAASLDLWFAYSGAPNKAKLLKVFEEDDKKLTPEVWRVVQFGDATLAAQALEGAGITKKSFDRIVEDEFEAAEKRDQGRAIGLELLRVQAAKAFAAVSWLGSGRNDVAGCYEAASVAGEGLLLENFADGSWKKATDLGISDSLLNSLSKPLGWSIVLLKNGGARLVIGHRRYEGKFDSKEKTITFTSRSGFTDELLKEVELLGDGLLAKGLRSRGEKDGTKLLLKRVPCFR